MNQCIHWSTSLCASTPTSDVSDVLVVYTTTSFFLVLRTCSAHVSLKNALPKVRLGHAFARLFSRSLDMMQSDWLLLWLSHAQKKHCGSYELLYSLQSRSSQGRCNQLIWEEIKCTTKGTTKTVFLFQIPILRCCCTGKGTILGTFFFSTIDTIDTIEPLSIGPNKHSTL